MQNAFANATTIWESWFFSDNTFSHNHPMFGSSEVWLIQGVLGIQPHPAARGMHHARRRLNRMTLARSLTAPVAPHVAGFDRVLIKPAPPRALHAANGSFETPRGTISVAWAWRADGHIALNVTIPPNVRATVHVPTSGDAGGAVIQVGSGRYAWGG